LNVLNYKPGFPSAFTLPGLIKNSKRQVPFKKVKQTNKQTNTQGKARILFKVVSHALK
jgi:hypothetical protein